MITPFEIVKDSSLWNSPTSMKAVKRLDNSLYTGTVRSVMNDKETGELRYVVEVYNRGDTIPVACRMVRRFGGAFNYEDAILRGYTYTTPPGISAKAGDVVLVGFLGGQGREGVILGGLTHPTRPNLKSDNGPEYKSEFNGIETYINKDGEYTLTFKAQPTNLADLDKDPNGYVPAPKYDADVGSSYMKWDKTGSFSLSDNAKNDPQRVFLDKKNGIIELTSGRVSLKLEKKSQKVTANCQVLEVEAKQKSVITSPLIKLGSDSAIEQSVLGTTYRVQEATMNSSLATSLTGMAASLTSAGAAITAAAADPVLAGLAPAAASSLATAGTAITAAAAQATAMAAAITSFEARQIEYLSNVVKVK